MGILNLLWRRYRFGLIRGLTLPGCLCLAAGEVAADHLPIPTTPAQAVSQQPPVLDLAACRRIALSQQPALAAAQDSLAMAEARSRALDRLLIPGIVVERDLPIRRHQAALGVQVAQAGVNLAEWETIYAVTRNYLSVLYARQQLDVVDRSLKQLADTRHDIAQIRDTGARRNVNEQNVEQVDVFIQIVKARREEAVVGLQRAGAALREAMGAGSDYCLVLADNRLPELLVEVCREQLIDLALARRAELGQATTVAEVMANEIKAQGTSHKPSMRTFASASDIHSHQVPQGVRNGEYRPGAVPMEMPPMLAGGRGGRVEQAEALHARALAVVDKTQNLIVLETEESYFKCVEARAKADQLAAAAKKARAHADRVRENFKASEQTTSETALNAGVTATQTEIFANEAHYHYLLALAALERITAGGFCPGLEAASAPR